MKLLNPFVNVESHKVRINPANAQALVRDYDLVLDGSDNALTRYLVNDACVLEKVPLS
jgi:molybdopterin/thiamine biosynthesis adenylyltransferase